MFWAEIWKVSVLFYYVLLCFESWRWHCLGRKGNYCCSISLITRHNQTESVIWAGAQHFLQYWMCASSIGCHPILLAPRKRVPINLCECAGWSWSSLFAISRFGSLATNKMSCEDPVKTAWNRRLICFHCVHIESCWKCCAPAHLTHCRLNRHSHTIYWKSPISILGTSG